MIAFLLLIVGGLNWLLWGAFQWEIGMLFGGSDALISRIIYVLVGVAAVFELVTHKKKCADCNVKKTAAPAASQHNMGGGDAMQ